MIPSYFTIKMLAWCMAGIVVAIFLMPDAALFPLIGLGVGLAGVWLLGKSTVGGAAVILLGVGFLVWGIAIRVKESRQVDEDAEKAADEISRRFRRSPVWLRPPRAAATGRGIHSRTPGAAAPHGGCATWPNSLYAGPAGP